MIYEVSHRTSYSYTQPVSISYHQLRLVPRASAHQTCRHAVIDIAPTPAERRQETDYFGNPSSFLSIREPHRELVVEARSVVEVRSRPVPEATPAWEAVVAEIRQGRGQDAIEALEYSFPSPLTPWLPEVEGFAREVFTPARPVLEAARALCHRIATETSYAPGSTTVATSVEEAFRLKSGVCQDFAQIGLTALRALGLPARYVSGYLLTRPPEGWQRLRGADASHAWLAVWVPGAGWIDLDPTNDLVVADEHITLAWGRDYGDVSPIAGVLFGGGSHRLSVEVDVAVMDQAGRGA